MMQETKEATEQQNWQRFSLVILGPAVQPLRHMFLERWRVKIKDSRAQWSEAMRLRLLQGGSFAGQISFNNGGIRIKPSPGVYVRRGLLLVLQDRFGKAQEVLVESFAKAAQGWYTLTLGEPHHIPLSHPWRSPRPQQGITAHSPSVTWPGKAGKPGKPLDSHTLLKLLGPLDDMDISALNAFFGSNIGLLNCNLPANDPSRAQETQRLQRLGKQMKAMANLRNVQFAHRTTSRMSNSDFQASLKQVDTCFQELQTNGVVSASDLVGLRAKVQRCCDSVVSPSEKQALVSLAEAAQAQLAEEATLRTASERLLRLQQQHSAALQAEKEAIERVAEAARGESEEAKKAAEAARQRAEQEMEEAAKAKREAEELVQKLEGEVAERGAAAAASEAAAEKLLSEQRKWFREEHKHIVQEVGSRVDKAKQEVGSKVEVVGSKVEVVGSKVDKLKEELKSSKDHEKLKQLLQPAGLALSLRKGDDDNFSPGSRQWLLGQFDKWLADGNAKGAGARLFGLLGVGGVGKSSFAARVCRLHEEEGRAGRVGGFYFFDHQERNSMSGAVKTLAHQLAQHAWLGGYREALLGVGHKQVEDAEKDKHDPVGKLLRLLVLGPLAALRTPPAQLVARGGKMFLLLDALDECADVARRGVFKGVCSLLRELPNWMGVAMTGRPLPRLRQELERQGLAATCTFLDGSEPENLRDLHVYVECRLREPERRFPIAEVAEALEIIAGQPGNPDKKGKAEGLFLYARKVLDYNEGGLRSLAEVRALPQGMKEWYEGQMARLLEALGQWLKSPEEAYQALRDMVVPLLEVVLSARRPLPLPQLTRLFDRELRDAFGAFSVEELSRKCFSELTGFVSVIKQPDGSEMVRPMHKSLFDWLTNMEEQAAALPEDQQPQQPKQPQQPQRLPIQHLDDTHRHPYQEGSGQQQQQQQKERRPQAKQQRRPRRRRKSSVEREQAEKAARAAAAAVVDRELPWRAFRLSRGHARLAVRCWRDLVWCDDDDKPECPLLRGETTREEATDKEEDQQREEKMKHGEEEEDTDACVGGLQVELDEDFSQLPHQQLYALQHCAHHLLEAEATLLERELRWDGGLAGRGQLALALCANLVCDLRFLVLRVKADGSFVPVLAELDRVAERATAVELPAALCERLAMMARFAHLELPLCGAGSAVVASLFQAAYNWPTEHSASWDSRHLERDHGCWWLEQIGQILEWVNKPGLDAITPFLFQLEGHSGHVNSVLVSSDGSRIASGSSDKTVRVWDASSGSCLQTLEGHSSTVNSVSMSSDGSRIVSGSFDKTVRVWDASSGACLRTLEGHSSTVNSVSMSSDGSRIVSGSFDKTVRVWDASSGACLRTLEGHSDDVMSVSMSSDGSRIVSGSFDKTVRVWDGLSGACLHTFEGHSDIVNSVSVSSDGSRIASGSSDNTVRVWDASSGSCLHALDEHHNRVTCVAWSSDGSRIISGSWDNEVRLWDASIGRCTQTLEGHSAAVSSVAWSSDGSRIVSGSRNKTIRVWDASNSKCAKTVGTLRDICSLAWSSDGSRIVSGSWDKTVRVWDPSSGKCTQTLEGHSSSVRSVAWSSDGSLIISGSHDKTVLVWDALSGERVHTLEGHSHFVLCLTFSSDGSRIITGSRDKTVRVWGTSSGTCEHTLKGHSDAVSCVALSNDGSRIASGSWDKTVRVWDAASGMCTQTLERQSSAVSSVAWSSDGSRIVSGSDGSSGKLATVWDSLSGKLIQILSAHTAAVSSVAWSNDGARIVTASWYDKTVCVWDASFYHLVKWFRKGTEDVNFDPKRVTGSSIAQNEGGMKGFYVRPRENVKYAPNINWTQFNGCAVFRLLHN